MRALDGVSLTVPQGQSLAVTGRSGSGKSTLLNLAAGIDVPTSGQIWIEGTELSRLSDDVLTRLRRDRIGVIYQFFNLISTLTVRENVALPAELAGRPAAAARAAADRLIDEVDLGARRDARPHALSGGEMQRAAIARALAIAPALVLADEPDRQPGLALGRPGAGAAAGGGGAARRHGGAGDAQPRGRRRARAWSSSTTAAWWTIGR